MAREWLTYLRTSIFFSFSKSSGDISDVPITVAAFEDLNCRTFNRLVLNSGYSPFVCVAPWLGLSQSRSEVLGSILRSDISLSNLDD